MSSQLQYLLIGACILGFAAMELITRCYQATVRDNATANDTWLEVLMFVSLIAITQPIALLGSNALCNWLMPAQHNAWANLPWWAMAGSRKGSRSSRSRFRPAPWRARCGRC